MRAAVSELEEDYGGRVVTAQLDCTTPSSRDVVKTLGFETHGLVLRAADGRILARQPDHETDIDAVRALIDAELGVAPKPKEATGS